jgi:hypothetical protein
MTLTVLSIVVLSVLMFAPAEISSTRAQDGELTPRFEYSESLGCGDVFFHARNGAKNEILRIEVDFSRLATRATRQAFDLTRLPPGVAVDVSLYKEPQINRPNCDDVRIFEVGKVPEKPQVWRPIRGTLEVVRGPKGVRGDEPWLFKATIRLIGAAFQGSDGKVLEMGSPFTWEGFVGWQAG